MEINGSTNHIVYGLLPTPSLVFALRGEATMLAGLRRALYEARTWGDFRSRLTEEQVAYVNDWLEAYHEDEDDFEHPPDDASFTADDIPGHADGDWPLWLAQRQLEWIPEDIQRSLGRREDSVFNGFFLTFDPEREDGIVAAFRSHGYSVERDDDLVQWASGYGER